MIDPTPAIRAACPHMSVHDVQVWSAAFSGPMPRYNITTINRTCGLMGQCAVETGGFVEIHEDMDYSAARMCAVWPREFPTLVSAIPYARNPEKLGNYIYALRNGNGTVASGDGYLCRGVGPLSTTGRDSLGRFAKAMGRTLSDAIDWAQTPSGGAELACWDWTDMRCNSLADGWQITALSERINGGDTALQDRILACNAALRAMQMALAQNSIPSAASTPPPQPISAQPDTAEDALYAQYDPGL